MTHDAHHLDRGSAVGGSASPASAAGVQLGGQLPNPIKPDLLSGAERIIAVCAILAAGLVRLRARQSRGIFAPKAENSIDNDSRQSGHAGKTRIRRPR